MRFVLMILALSLLPGPAAAQNSDGAALCPASDEPVSARHPDLFDALKRAESEIAGLTAEDAIWRAWTTAPDEAAQTLLDDGMRRIRAADYTGAERQLDQLVTYCPRYAEGHNQRAFARFLQGRLDASLGDIETVLILEPKHFGALSGKIRILFQQGRIGLARATLAEALAIHPWLPERRALPLGPAGQEL